MLKTAQINKNKRSTRECNPDVTERTDFEIGMLVTEFIADRDSQEHTGQTTGCRHGDADTDTERLRG